MKNSKFYYFSALFFLFALGALIWKISKTGQTFISHDEDQIPNISDSRATPVIKVGEQKIMGSDIEFEYQLLTRVLQKEKENITPIPAVENEYEKDIPNLRNKLLSDLIERKALYQYVKQSGQLNLDDPAIYTNCMKEWQDTTTSDPNFWNSKEKKELLKYRLCEQDLIHQFQVNVLFANITVSPSEIENYYAQNQQDYLVPAKATIRQIVLEDEKKAKDLLLKLNKNNFSWMAKEHSISPEGQDGGILGPFAKGEMPRVFDIAFTMNLFQISPVIKSTYGFHIIMLINKSKKKQLTMDQVHSEITQILLEEKKQGAYTKWVDEVLKSVSISTPQISF